jgi:Bacterial aa3 type cytochrome c oxidase subunit IV
MAGDGETNGDLKAHAESYDRFIGWLKFGAIATALVTALVIFLITR